MTPRRFSIAGLMALTAAVGLTLAAARRLVVDDTSWAICLVPPAVLLELAAFRCFRSQGGKRWFWAGFVAAGLVAMASLVAAIANQESVISRAWSAATEGLARFLVERVQIPRPVIPWFGATLLMKSGSIFLIMAGSCLMGGVAGLGLGRWWMASRSGRGADSPTRPALK